MLRTSNLKFDYNQNNVFSFPDVEVAEKESLLLLGQSGIGKTTLLHLLGGLMKPKDGSIFIAEKDITKLNGRELDTFRGKNIGIVFQQNHFIEALNVLENITIASQMIGVNPDKKRAQDLLHRLNLQGKENNKINNLSQGERQRVAIARAVINNPRLILADEPTSALDDKNCIEVYRLLEEQASYEKAALVIVTHDYRLKNQVSKQIILQ